MIPAVAIGLAAWLILAALCLPGWACTVGRLKRRFARREFTDWTLSLPEVPGPVLPADASLEQLEQAVYDGMFRDTVRREFPQYREFRGAA